MTCRQASRYNHAMNLFPERISSFCRPAARRVEIRAVEETGSTNADLLAALDTLAAPTLLIARTQTAGRGRAGRSWLSVPGKSLTFSLAWKFHAPLQALIGLPLATGVAIAEALAGFDAAVALKWPNDVLYDGKKLAGILIESVAAAHNECWTVIGIGINLAAADTLTEQVGHAVADLSKLAELDRHMLMAALLNSLAEAMEEFEHEGLVAFMQRWNALHAYAGKEVVITDNGKLLHRGIAVGIDEVGRLVVDTGKDQIAMMAGDVSLRPVGE